MSQGRSNVYKLRDIVNVKDPAFGAKGTGAVDDHLGIQAAIDSLSAGGSVFFPHGRYPLGARIDVDDNSYVHLVGEGYGSVIEKNFNGDMISLGLKGEMSELRLDGKGASFTGRGVIISTGNGGDGWQNIHDCTILDTESYCIEYTASGAGWNSRIVSNRLDTYSRATFAVKYPDVDVNGPRTLANNVTLGPLADLAAAHGINVIGNTGGENVAQTVPSIQMTDDIVRAVVVGNTFESTTSITIKGDQGIWADNIMRAGYTLASGATNNQIRGNNGSAVANFDTDNSGNVSNYIHGLAHTYTPTWTGSVSNPDIGNGILAGKWQRFGRRVSLDIQVTMGSGTTFGSGTYTFGLPPGVPAPGAGNSIGVARFFDSGTIIRTGICVVSSTGITCEADSGTGAASNTVPFTWANGDKLWLNAVYDL